MSKPQSATTTPNPYYVIKGGYTISLGSKLPLFGPGGRSLMVSQNRHLMRISIVERVTRFAGMRPREATTPSKVSGILLYSTVNFDAID